LDFSLFKIISVQLIHLFAAVPILAYLRYKQYTFDDVERILICLFVIQTIIQIVAVCSFEVTEFLYQFNKADKIFEEQIADSRVRGRALSAATTYHLSLLYGAIFILYVKRFISKDVSILYVITGLFLFVGIFFAGRTGFVGVAIILLFYFLSISISLTFKLKVIIYNVLISFFTLSFLSVLFPSFYDLLNEYILPYAFEFIYSAMNEGTVETRSTNQLMGMWNTDFDMLELIVGSGKYTDISTGAYYMHVDPGILRHLLFFGVFGYLCLLVYQCQLLPFWKMGENKLYYGLIFLYLCAMEFKAVTLGVNKFVFSFCLLLSYSYFELKKNHTSSTNR
jgi:hypothetical protein